MKSKTYTVDENMIKFSSILDDKTNNGFVSLKQRKATYRFVLLSQSHY